MKTPGERKRTELRGKARASFLERLRAEARLQAKARARERAAVPPGREEGPAPRQLVREAWRPAPATRVPGTIPQQAWAREERFVVRPTEFWGGPLNQPAGGHSGVTQLSDLEARAFAGSWNLAGGTARADNGCYLTFDLPIFTVTGRGWPVAVTVETHGALTWTDVWAASYGKNSWGEVEVSSSINFQTFTGHEYEGYDVIQGFSRTGDWEAGVSEVWQPSRLPPRTCNRHTMRFRLASGQSAWIWIYQGLVLQATRHHRVDRCSAAVDLTYAVEPFVITVRDVLPTFRGR